MAKTSKPSGKDKQPQPANKAKAEFQDYKSRMERAKAAAGPGHLQFGTGLPFSGPLPGGASWPSMSGAVPPGSFSHQMDALLGQTGGATTGMMADRVGETVNLGVQLLYSGLGVGLRFLQGLSGGRDLAHDEYCHCQDGGPYHPSGHGCGGGCHCNWQDCCQVMCHEPACCCTPSVGTCC